MEHLVEWGIVLAAREQCDSLIYASGLENQPELLNKILSASSCQLYGNSPSVLQKVRDPVALSHNLRRAGFKAPVTRGPDDKLDSQRLWLVKPLKSGGGHGIATANQGKTIPVGSVCQEYLSGEACSFTFVADGKNCLVLGITEQLTIDKSYTGRDFGYAGNLFPLEAGDQKKLFDTVTAIAHWLTANYGLMGLNGVDFILHDEDCWVIEVNPRYSASMELFELAYGFPMIKLHLLACSGVWEEVKRMVERLPVELTLYRPERIWAKKVIYTKTRTAVRSISSGRSDEEVRTWAHRMHTEGLRDLPFPGDLIPAKKPVATAIAAGANREDCLNRLEAISSLMRNQLSQV